MRAALPAAIAQYYDYDIHELLRQYGEELLRSSPPLYEQALDLHRAYYMRFLGEREKEVVFLERSKEAIEKMNKCEVNGQPN